MGPDLAAGVVVGGTGHLGTGQRNRRSGTGEGSPLTVTGHKAVSPVPDLTQSLLDAKISAPHPRPGAVSRVNVVNAARACDCRVVAVTAPAGYGKSTFLAQWAAQEDRRVAWVSLDRFDDDPGMLLVSLASAYRRAGLGSADLVADMGGPGVSALGRAAPRLAAEFRASAEPFVLMLDDLHELVSPACHDVLSLLIQSIPHGSQLAVASRCEQPHLPRLRACGEALELEARDLALDAAGARQIFDNAQVSLAPELAAAVIERTEGWPVGVYLAALIARQSRGQVPTLSGADRYVADYLYREALTRQPKAIQRFLRRSAVPDQLCAPLCEAVLGTSAAALHLRQIEAHSLFLTPLDREREWYRYHGLFREFLLGELRRTEPGIIATLHQRAADWYQASGFPGQAVEHLLHTPDRGRSMRLVTALAHPTYMAGKFSTVQRWLRAIGDGDIERYPPLAVQRCWGCVVTGDTAGAARWAAVVDGASFDGVPGDGSASFDSTRAMVRAAMCAAGPDQMMADAAFAVAQEPPWSPWRDTALWQLAEAHLLGGHLDQAGESFAEASVTAAQNGNVDTIAECESQLACLAMDRGEWQDAARRVEFALATIEDHRLHDYVTSIPAFCAAARLSLHHGALDRARQLLVKAMRARTTATYLLPYLAVRLRLQLAKVCLAVADSAKAHQLLHEIDDVLIHRPALGTLIDDVRDFRTLIASSAASGSIGMPPLTPAELRLLPYLQTHLTADRIAERLFLSSHTVKTQVKSIYRKLDVSSRNDAVQKAMRVGLLGN